MVGISRGVGRARAGLLCAGILAGCVTVSALRESPPVRVGTAAGAYLPLAACVRERLETTHAAHGVTYALQDRAAVKSASLVGIARFPAGLFYTVPAPLLELSFHQTDQRTVKIEARRIAGGAAFEPGVWSVIAECAGGDVAPSPLVR
jgi:hypothetical protein